MKITSQVTRQIETELQAALDAVAAKFGLVAPRADVRRFRNDIGVRIMKLDMMTASFAPTVTTVTSSVIAHDLPSAMARFGITNTMNSKGDELIKFNPNAPKFCFQYRSIRGTVWNCTADQAKKRFG